MAGFIIFLLGALIGWDIHYRGQQAVSISLMEEIWTRNIVNMLLAPIRYWEWMAASGLYALLKVGLVTVLLTLLARWLYAFDLLRVGWVVVPLGANLLVFGCAIGLLTAGLLLRFGYAAEALIWGIPFLMQPFSCVFYPLHSLPAWAQGVARCLPSTYVFEALRSALREGTGFAPAHLCVARGPPPSGRGRCRHRYGGRSSASTRSISCWAWRAWSACSAAPARGVCWGAWGRIRAGFGSGRDTRGSTG
jgi:ABC-2 type transport system permease protein